MLCLRRGCASRIQRQPHHQAFDPAAIAMTAQHHEVCVKPAALQGWQGRHRDPQLIAAGQSDATAPDIEAEHGTDDHPDQRLPRLGVGNGACPGRRRPNTCSKGRAS